MNNKISREALLERIMREVPSNSHIVPISTPVVSFGDLYKADVVSIGINPSVDEFMTRHSPRRVLPVADKRFVDYESLGIPAGSPISKENAQRILDSNFNYFKKNPYHWFNRMEKYLVKPAGASYFDGTAAHLDLVQWATDPVWQNIKDRNVAKFLIEKDKNFLITILENSGYKLILLNGATVVKTIQSLGLFNLKQVGKVSYGNQSSLLLEGVFGNTSVKATTLNIPAAQGLEGPEQVASWLLQAK